MNNRPARYFLISMALALTATVGATEEIATERSELMKSVREATKPVGAMLRGKAEFNAEEIQASLAVYADAASKLGDLVPAGSEGGEAAPAIWEDPEGFSAAIKEWQTATAAAIEANPQDLDSARPVVGAVLNTCKGCHDNYRIEKD